MMQARSERDPAGTGVPRVRTASRLITLTHDDGLSQLRQRIVDGVLDATARCPDPELSCLVDAAVASFVDSGADPVRAARQVAEPCRAIGERHALLGRDSDELATAYGAARVSAQRALALAFGKMLSGDELIVLRERIVVYLQQLFGQTMAGFTRAQRIKDLEPDRRLDLLRDQLFLERRPRALSTLAPLCGFDPDGAMRPVVSADRPLPGRLLGHEATVAGHDPREVLVPASWSVDEIDERLKQVVALGPAVPLDRVPEAVRLTRAAAELVVDEHLHAEHVLGPLVTRTSPLICELLESTYLQVFDELQPSRRLNVAETLLHWLQTGQPINGVARALGIPAQTAHSRVATARRLLGGMLEDPEQRLELILALRSALPRWRADAA